MTSTGLKAGSEFTFTDPNEENGLARFFWSETLGKFCLEFNAMLLCTSQTFAPALKRLNTLRAKWSLTEETEEEF